eukprot:678120-Prorocentrum_minimum.AAC.1
MARATLGTRVERASALHRSFNKQVSKESLRGRLTLDQCVDLSGDRRRQWRGGGWTASTSTTTTRRQRYVLEYIRIRCITSLCYITLHHASPDRLNSDDYDPEAEYVMRRWLHHVGANLEFNSPRFVTGAGGGALRRARGCVGGALRHARGCARGGGAGGAGGVRGRGVGDGGGRVVRGGADGVYYRRKGQGEVQGAVNIWECNKQCVIILTRAVTEPRAGVCHAGDLREWRVGHRGGDRWQRAGVRRAAQWHAAP